MIPSDEKIRAMVLRVIRSIEKEPGVVVRNHDAMLRSVKNGVEAGLELLRNIDSIATQKIVSLSRKVQPGTREWDELYARYVSEERKRRGL